MSGFPKPTGEYNVGTFTFTIYNDRPETLPLKDPGMRSIPVRVYYPTSSVEGLSKTEALSRTVCKGLGKFMIPVSYEKITNDGQNVSECYTEAARFTDRRFPLIIYSHGYGLAYRESNSLLLIDLASHGYVVMSVGHPYEGCASELDDGTEYFLPKKLTNMIFSPYIPASIATIKLCKMKGSIVEQSEQCESFVRNYGKFAMDRVAEWEKDTLSALSYAKENLSDMIDFSYGVGSTGHSFGGATSYALCHDSSEFVCGIDIDGILCCDNEGKVMKKPFMMISCDDNKGVVSRGLIKHTERAYQVLFKDMKHVGFSDMKFFITSRFMTGALSAELMHENLCRAHLIFFDTYLKKSRQTFDLEDNDTVKVSTFEPDI